MSKIYDALQSLESQRKAIDGGESSGPVINPLDLQEHPLAAARATTSTAPALLERAAAIGRFGTELHRRMGEAGLDGLPGLFALAEQLQRALATVSTPELDTATADLDRVAERIRAMRDELGRVKAVKAELESVASGVTRR